jgi:acyl-CoA hydrolase
MPKTMTMDQVLSLLAPGIRVLLHAGPAESLAFREALRAAPDHAAHVTFTGLFIPNINGFDYGSLTSTTRVESLFVPAAARETFEAGRLDLLPIHYSAFPDHLRRFPSDLALLRLPPPRNGLFSCGVAGDIAEGVRRFARRIIVLVDPSLPYTHGGVAIGADEVEGVVEIEEPAPAEEPDAPDARLDLLAGAVADFVEDGDTLQIGIGKLPASVLRKLRDRRRLRFHSGMITDETAHLFKAGAIADPSFGETLSGQAPILTGIAHGGDAVRRLVSGKETAVHGVDVTHDVRRIATIPRFVAINSAIEVDLFGQVNSEAIGPRQVSGIGGSVDFTRAARLSPGGRAIMALQSRTGEKPRIVPRLASDVVSLGRADMDTLATESGAVRLRDLGIDARAEAIIGLADSRDRAALAEAWAKMRAKM